MATRRRFWRGLAALSLLALCLAPGLAATRPPQRPAGPGAEAGSVPTDPDALFAWLQAGSYTAWKHESEVHDSTSYHPKVRTFMNGKLYKSMQARRRSHPKGSAAVKELWSDDGELMGWAVSVKLAANSKRGKNWYWYEVHSTTDGSEPVSARRGNPLCSNCHGPRRDYVCTPWPMK